MKARWKWIVLGVITAVALAVGFAAAWVFWGRSSFELAEAKVKEEAVLLNGHDPQRMLTEANRFYCGHNLPPALPDGGTLSQECFSFPLILTNILQPLQLRFGQRQLQLR
jgi:hypothetical protein